MAVEYAKSVPPFTEEKVVKQRKSNLVLSDKKIEAIAERARQAGPKPFDEIETSTKTVIAITNCIFDLNEIYRYFPVTPYVLEDKKRSRKKMDDSYAKNMVIPDGSVIRMQYKNNVKGVVSPKNKKKDKETFFLNSITLVLIIKESGSPSKRISQTSSSDGIQQHNKKINVKVSKNGKLQLTGIKSDDHFVESVRHIFKYMDQLKSYTGKEIYEISNGEEFPKIIFNVVMKNIDFNLNFSVDRESLDMFINENTEYFSLFESSINTGVNIKKESLNPYDSNMICLKIKKDESEITSVLYSDYFELLDEKEKQKLLKKKKKFTFLVFQSGSCILSGSGGDMKKTYEEFMCIMNANQQVFEEKLDF